MTSWGYLGQECVTVSHQLLLMNRSNITQNARFIIHISQTNVYGKCFQVHGRHQLLSSCMDAMFRWAKLQSHIQPDCCKERGHGRLDEHPSFGSNSRVRELTYLYSNLFVSYIWSNAWDCKPLMHSNFTKYTGSIVHNIPHNSIAYHESWTIIGLVGS